MRMGAARYKRIWPSTGLATIKSDVYSFDVILMALMPTYDHQLLMINFDKFSNKLLIISRHKFNQTVEGKCSIHSSEEMGRLAVRCVSAEDGRPAMAEVARQLEMLRT
uniref:Uncharacterized protein n=1 Tax=Leersia perrieri TaxID=77586 RepID=A0A0D9XT51_9ORYZ